jgi:hypothetical protein
MKTTTSPFSNNDMHKRSKTWPDHRRITIADEAARIIQEQGLADFRIAKEKAVERLGRQLNGAMPSNREVEQALAERNRIFLGDSHREYLRALRLAAVTIMRSLAPHQPRLVGPVLSGHVTEHSAIDLHLFCDSPEEVGSSLDTLGIKHRSIQRRQRLNRNRTDYFPGYQFFTAEFEFYSTVFQERRRHHAPLSPVDGRPMRRATTCEILSLLEGAQIQKGTNPSTAY